MTDHLLDHVRPHLDRGTEERIAYIQAPRWIGHQVAVTAQARLAELLSRQPSLRTPGPDARRPLCQRQDDDRRTVRRRASENSR